MPVVLFAMRLLEIMFFVGIAGSAIVVAIATAEDMRELFSKTEHIHAEEKTPAV
jgi:cell division protein FtsL